MTQTFGKFVQVVLSKVVENHGINDPILHLSSNNDPEGQIFDLLLESWQFYGFQQQEVVASVIAEKMQFQDSPEKAKNDC